MDKIWVLAEQSDGVPVGIVLELLTAARGFAAVVEAVTWGPGSEGVAAAVGRYGATRLYDLGDIGESLPGPSPRLRTPLRSRTGTAPTRSSSVPPTTAVTSRRASRRGSTCLC